jgi:hypothetical protein
VLLLAAAVLMALFALDMLGVPGLGRLLPRVPGGSKTSGTGSRRPAALGAATVLLPCGVTLSMELVAVASGNALTGAAVMAAFVLGTVPLNAALGWALDVSTRVLRGRLVRVVGVCVLAVAVWTALSGLRLGGWYAPQSSAAADGGAARMGADGVQTVTVRAVKDGYRPARVAARAGVPTVLLLRSADLYGCTRAVVIPGRDVQRLLPATGETTIDLGVPDSGALKFSCAMGMYGGRIDFSATP